MLLLTGATGFLGGELLVRLLQAEERPEIGVLIRGTDGERRFHELKRKLQAEYPAAQIDSRVRLIRGDVTLEHFGLGAQGFLELAAKTTKIIHCAASTNLGQSLEGAREINVGGTKNSLDLARLNRDFDTFFHISTAYVAGDTTDSVTADMLSPGGNFKNSYEQSKAEAELLVRNAGVEHCVLRPSIIVGDSETGITSSFNVLYVPVKLLVRGFFSALPLSVSAPCDIVPVNYVADAAVSLCGYSRQLDNGKLLRAANRQGRAYHLAAGIGRESTPSEMVEAVIRAFNRSRLSKFGALHIPAFITPEMLNFIYHSICVARTGVKNLEKLFIRNITILTQALPFLPYMIRNPRFDTRETERDLAGILPPAPLFASYAERLFLYCFESDWGKNPLTPIPAGA